MPALAHVAVHASQFPDAVRLDLLESLRSRKINHKFHYDSLKQTQKWLALHQAYSPSRTDPGCAAVYNQGFIETTKRLAPGRAHLVGLGCGGGQKDLALLKRLQESGRETSYTPCDVGVAMVLTAQKAVLDALPATKCFPLVCDLATADDLPALFSEHGANGDPIRTARLFTFFGMIPNFEPETILPKLAAFIASNDQFLLSANLAPGRDYGEGVKRVLPLYDNELTRDWLRTFLLDLGIEKPDGELRFVIEESTQPVLLERIGAYFHFTRKRIIELDDERFEFRAGDSMRLFFSYRHTPALLQTLLAQYGLTILKQWITASEEEGVFLVNKT